MSYLLGKGGQFLYYKCTEETTFMLPWPRETSHHMEEIQTFLPYSHAYILFHFHSIPNPGSTSGLERAIAESLESRNLELRRSGFKLWLCCLLAVCPWKCPLTR